MKRLTFCAALVVASIGLLASFAGAATTTGTIGFETSEGYTVGDINGQPTIVTNTWTKTGPYDVAVASLTSFADPSAGFAGDSGVALVELGNERKFRRPDLLAKRRCGRTVDAAAAFRRRAS